MEKTKKLTNTLNRIEKEYRKKQIREEEEYDKKLQTIRESHQPIDYDELNCFSVTYESKRFFKKLENDEKIKTEKLKNKEILPILDSYKEIMKNSFVDEEAVKKEAGNTKRQTVKDYSTYVKKHFLPPIKNLKKPNLEIQRETLLERKRNSAEKQLKAFNEAYKAKELGKLYLQEVKSKIRKTEKENKQYKENPLSGEKKIVYKNYLNDVKVCVKKEKKIRGRAGERKKLEELKDIVDKVDHSLQVKVLKQPKNYLESIRLKLDLLNNLK